MQGSLPPGEIHLEVGSIKRWGFTSTQFSLGLEASNLNGGQCSSVALAPCAFLYLLMISCPPDLLSLHDHLQQFVTKALTLKRLCHLPNLGLQWVLLNGHVVEHCTNCEERGNFQGLYAETSRASVATVS